MKNLLIEEFYLSLTQMVLKLKLLEQEETVCYNVTIPQSYTIKIIDHYKKLSMKELSANMGVSMSTMTRIIDILVRDEIVNRFNNPGDRRSFFVELTPKGKDLAKKLKVCTLNYLKSLFEKMNNFEQEQLVQSIKKLNSVIEINKSCCEMKLD